MSQKVKAIPEGYHSVTPFLTLKEAEKLIKFYEKAFDAKVMERHNTPDGKIMHAVIKIGDSYIMLADEFPEYGCGTAAPVSLKGTTAMLHLYVEDVDAAFKKAVAAGAKVQMPVADMFWGDRYGQVEDPSGHLWSLATHKKDMNAGEIEQGAKACMSKETKS